MNYMPGVAMLRTGTEVIISRTTGRIVFLRSADRAALNRIVDTAQREKPRPTYTHLLVIFDEAAHVAFRAEKGLVVLADEARLVEGLVAFAVNLAREFAPSHEGVGAKVTAKFLVFLLDGKFGQPPNLNRLRVAVRAAARTDRPDREPLEELVQGCVAASSFPRLNRWRISHVLPPP